MLDKYDYTFNYEESLIHLMNPVVKFISLIFYIVLCFLPYNNYLFIILLSYVFGLLLLSNIKFKRYFKTLWKFKFLFLILFFYLYSVDVSFYNGMIISFKIVFFILHFFLILFTCTKSDYVRGLCWILDRFNIFGIKRKKIYNFLDKKYTYFVNFIKIFNNTIEYKELNGKNYLYSDLFVKMIFIFSNIKMIKANTKDSILVREKDKKYKLFDMSIVNKYKYVNKLNIVDYLVLIINIGMVIFYVLKVR